MHSLPAMHLLKLLTVQSSSAFLATAKLSSRLFRESISVCRSTATSGIFSLRSASNEHIVIVLRFIRILEKALANRSQPGHFLV